MSTAVFHYDAIGRAADRARKSAGELDDFREELDKKVSRKLDSYGGRRTSNITTVMTQIRRKKDDLSDKAGRFRSYGRNLDALSRECQAADIRVKGRISTLCQSFAIRHDIQISARAYRDAMLATERANRNKVSRWFSDQGSKVDDWFDDAGNRIAHWYQYGGGKYIIWENLKAALKIALGVVTVIAAIATFTAGVLTGGAVLLLVAGVVAGVMTALDGAVDVGGNIAAGMITEDDPVRAKRVSEVDELTEFMRLSYNRDVHNWAASLDAVTLVANVINLASGIKNLATKGYRWVTSGTFKPSEFKWLKDFHWKDLGTGITKHLTDFKLRASDLRSAVNMGDWKTLGNFTSTFGRQFASNVKAPFAKAFTDIGKLDMNKFSTYKNGFTGWRSILIVGKGLISDNFYKTALVTSLSGFATGDIGSGSLVSLQDCYKNLLEKPIKYGGDFMDLFRRDSLQNISTNTYDAANRIRRGVGQTPTNVNK